MKHWIGIDVSKATLDVALLDEHGKVTAEEQVANTEKGLRSMWKRWTKAFGLAKGECLVCLEPTGHYSHLPLETLVQLEVLTWLAHPTDIIRSIGATRGKNDRIDALRIADYARRFHDKARLVTPDGLRTNKLKQLLTRRENLVRRKTMHHTQIRNLNKCMDKSLQTAFTRIDKAQIAALGKSIEQIEALIAEVIAADAEHQASMTCSCPLMVSALCWQLICWRSPKASCASRPLGSCPVMQAALPSSTPPAAASVARPVCPARRNPP